MVQVISVPYMNAEDEAFSYATNSLLQMAIIPKAEPVVEETIKSMFTSSISFPATTLNITDFGCSSGPNIMLAISEILNTIHQLSSSQQPKVQVFLNDLPGNDFNSIFKSLSTFYQKYQMGTIFISRTRGSFYGRLFPDKRMHLLHSSNSLHWLSSVPELMECDKGHVYLSKFSSLGVFEAYLEQFWRDF